MLVAYIFIEPRWLTCVVFSIYVCDDKQKQYTFGSRHYKRVKKVSNQSRIAYHNTKGTEVFMRYFIVLSFLGLEGHHSARVARNPRSTTSEIAAAPSDQHSRGETVDGDG